MNFWKRFTTRAAPDADALSFAPDATPSADQWLVAFTESFMRRPNAAYTTKTLMSSLRFFTAEFVAAIASLPPPEEHQPPIPGRVPKAIYRTAGSIVGDVYQRLISRNAGRGQIQVAFEQAVPVLVGEYKQSMR